MSTMILSLLVRVPCRFHVIAAVLFWGFHSQALDCECAALQISQWKCRFNSSCHSSFVVISFVTLYGLSSP